MKTPTYEDYLANPQAVKEQVGRAARRERAEAVDRFIVEPIKQLINRMALKQALTAVPQRA